MYTSVAEFDKTLSLKANKVSVDDLSKKVQDDYVQNEEILKVFIA